MKKILDAAKEAVAIAKGEQPAAGHSYVPHVQWRPISTAPVDGREFLAVNKDKLTYRVVYFDDEAKEPYIWHVEDAGKGFNHHRDFFTHWRPLPEFT